MFTLSLPFQLIEVNGTITINVVHFESPRQLLLSAAGRSDMEGEHELPEVDGATSVSIKCAEDYFTESVGSPTGENLVFIVKNIFWHSAKFNHGK